MFNHHERHITPGGRISQLYDDMAHQTHLLIAGTTGSGKSVVINGIIHSQLAQHASGTTQLILIDPKRCELSGWKNAPHTLKYAAEMPEIVSALQYTLNLIDSRYKAAERQGKRVYDGPRVYLVIDELAAILTQNKRVIKPLLARILMTARASNVMVIAATQAVLTGTVPTEIRICFDSVLGLHTLTPQQSRNIVGMNGLESLPKYGKGYYLNPTTGASVVTLPMIPDDELNRVSRHWSDRRLYVA